MAGGNLTKQQAQERAALISDVSYEIDLDLTTAEDTFGSETTIKFNCSEPGATTFLDFAAPDVLQIVFNGREVSLDACQNRRILVTGTQAQNEIRIQATCKYSHTGYGLHRFTDPSDGGVYVYSDFEPFQANRVFPCFDQPDLKATFDIKVRVPVEWVVISNMPVVESDQGKWRFERTPLMSTYLAAIVAGPYHSVFDQHDGIDLGIYCRRSLARYLDADEFFEITKQGFDYYHGAFDYRYPFGKYDQVMVPEFNAGAMENAGCVTFSERYIYRSRVTDATRERRAEVILHEMAHMWFGDLVTMRWWDDLWLNESFATFMALLSQDVTRFKNGWVTFANDVKTAARRQDQLPTTHPIVSNVPDTQSTRVMFDAIAYNKGSAVLRQLFAWVGEKAFFEGIKVYFRRHEFGNTDLTDFLRVLEESSGRDLQAWSREWLETAGLNTLEPIFEEQGGVYRSFAIEQDSPPRSHRLAIGLYDSIDGGMSLRRRVELDVAGQRTEVPELEGEQPGDLVLLNEGDLAYAKVRPDEQSMKTMTLRLKDLGDPLARALCWAMAWDLLYDGVISTGDYVELVLNHAGQERDLSILQTITEKPRSINAGVPLFLLGQTRVAALVYGDPAKATSRSALLAEAAQRFFESSEAGGDYQLMWLRFFAGIAASPEQLSYLREVLDGRRRIEGCIVDHELRWWILQWLAAAGEADQDLIDAELKRDPTDAGKRFALSARAAMNSAQEKEWAWSTIVDDESLPRAEMVALMIGFQNPTHAELLEPYREKYFGALPGMWEEREGEVSEAFASVMYPHFVIDETTLRRTDEYLQTDPPAPLRRILLEGREGIDRALITRDRDSRR